MKHVMEEEWQIQKIIDGIDNAVDAKDWGKTQSYFAHTIQVDFGTLGDGRSHEMPSADLIAAWSQNLYAGKKSFHLRGNHHIEINDNLASAFSKGYAFNAIDEGAVTGIWEVWGNYIYTLMKESDGWKVTSMTLQVIQTRGDDHIRTYMPE